MKELDINSSTDSENSKSESKISIAVFLLIFLLEMAGGIYYGYFQDTVLNDAFSRTANAYYVLFIKPLRFASIGLVWNPLPSMLQLPFVWIARYWKPMVLNGISASIVTSAFAALSCSLLYKTFRNYHISRFKSLTLLTFYGMNPFIFFYGFNGMSEMLIFCMMIYSISYLNLWFQESLPNYIMKIGFALAIAFLCRYEAIPYAAAVGLGIVLIILFRYKGNPGFPNSNQNSLKEKYYYIEGTGIILYTPLLYAIFVWIMFNWIITGNPLYFLNSAYSNPSQSQYAAFIGTPLKALLYVFTKSIPFIPVFVAIVILRAMSRRLLKIDFLILLLIVLTMLFFHFLMLLGGNSYGWLRFFSYVLPISMAWIPYELSEIKDHSSQNLAFLLLAFSLLVSSYLTSYYLSNPQLAPEENNLTISSESHQISDYINDNLPDERILTDSFLTGSIILNINNIDNIVTSASLGFYDIVANPLKYGVTYILVPDPSGIGHLDAINREYPALYAHGLDWCVKVKDFDGFRLFKVIY
ncbi:hypothetical protein [Desulfosporosinus sp. FKA]|uniref:hypothetical protein n=1 Tax=Desulfosporosinus sp. FKA TaxID=1969834 RepID=UPI001FA82B94|nr:hypothetical protein [Desulfosporosinus sp. FKA]